MPILGTSPGAIDWPRTGSAFRSCCAASACASRRTTSATDQDEALRRAERIGFPLVIRPSYVLGGRAMRIVHDVRELGEFMAAAAQLTELGRS